MFDNDGLPVSGSRWTHHTSQQVYTVLFITNKGTLYPDKHPVTVVYVGSNGKLWSRPALNWLDSFTFLTGLKGETK